jgi:hypothetical protein
LVILGNLEVLLFFIKSPYHCDCTVLVLSILYFSWFISLPNVSLTKFCLVSIFIQIQSFTCSGKFTCNSKTRQMFMPVYCTWMVARYVKNQGFTNPWWWVAAATKLCTVGRTTHELEVLTCFMSLFSSLEFWAGALICGKYVHRDQKTVQVFPAIKSVCVCVCSHGGEGLLYCFNLMLILREVCHSVGRVSVNVVC